MSISDPGNTETPEEGVMEEKYESWMDKYNEFITRLMIVEDGVIRVISDDEIPGYTDESGFRNFMLDMELGENYEVITVRIPSRTYEEESEFSRKFWAIHTFMNEFKPWIMWNDDEKKFTMARPIPGRKWGVWDKIRIAKNTPKSPKRINIFSQSTAIHKMFPKSEIIPAGEHDEPHGDDTLTIQYLDDPTDKVMADAIDGKFRVRRSVMNMLIDEYEERTGNTEQANRFRQYKRWNSRWAFELFGRPVLGKGDHIVCIDDLMAADVVIHDSNVKQEIGSTGSHVLVQMFPQEQNDKAQSDRQAVSNFNTSALTPEILKRALYNEVTDIIDRFQSGKLPFDVPAADVDNRGRMVIGAPLRATFNKINAFLSTGRSLNDSPYLMKMAAGQVSKMMGDMADLSDADHDRKFPIPNAWRVSLGNVLDIEWSRGKRIRLPYNTAFIDPTLGLMMSTHTYSRVIPVLGGADGDDHVVVIEMIAGFSDDFFGFNTGDVIYFVYRSPVGNGSDGVRVASEFWIFKAKNQTPKNYMELEVLESRPVCVAELGDIEYTWFGGEKELEEDGYTSRQAWKNIVAATEMTGSFGLYCNLLMIMVNHQIPFVPDAPMETYVDEAQQKMSKSGMAHIAATTSIFKGIIEDSGVLLDHYEAARIGSEMPTKDGLFTELVTYHLSQQNRFLAAAKEHILTRTMELKEENKEATVDWMVRRHGHSRPGVLDMIREAELKFQEKRGRKPSRHMDFEKVGTYVAGWMDTLIKSNTVLNFGNEDVLLTEEMFLEHLRQSWAWALSDANPNLTSRSIETTVHCNDRRLLMGALLDRIVEALND